MQYKNKSTKKYVYLFELDSVRKTDEEKLAAQKALYNEIVVNGNTGVMTYNGFTLGAYALLKTKMG